MNLLKTCWICHLRPLVSWNGLTFGHCQAHPNGLAQCLALPNIKGRCLIIPGVQKCLSIWFTNGRTGLSKAVNFLEWALTLDIKCQLWEPWSPRVSFSRDIANFCRLCIIPHQIGAIENRNFSQNSAKLPPYKTLTVHPYWALPGEVVAPVLVCNKSKSWSFLTVMA
jgi:hypothetical protein